jgi:hypothetical protein
MVENARFDAQNTQQVAQLSKENRELRWRVTELSVAAGKLTDGLGEVVLLWEDREEEYVLLHYHAAYEFQ